METMANDLLPLYRGIPDSSLHERNLYSVLHSERSHGNRNQFNLHRHRLRFQSFPVPLELRDYRIQRIHRIHALGRAIADNPPLSLSFANNRLEELQWLFNMEFINVL